MANQLFTDGDVHELGGETLECVSVSYREEDGEKSGFVYSFRLKSELDAEREAARKAEEEAAAADPANQEVEENQTVTPVEEQ